MRIINLLLIFALLLPAVSGRADDASPKPEPTRTELALFAMGLIGAVYKPGGDNPSTGMDCSGFVKYVYSEVAGLKLPHNALAMSKISAEINKTELRPGDLVFFKTMKTAFSHVGIYLGDNRFIHAASSRTGVVMISHLDDPYWSAKFDGARRLINPISAITTIPNAAAATE
ncbi:MAG: C40 family peptidase [Sulfuriferula sp.]|nr:C40 family peptidase [Sulfuriferula sp.]